MAILVCCIFGGTPPNCMCLATKSFFLENFSFSCLPSLNLQPVRLLKVIGIYWLTLIPRGRGPTQPYKLLFCGGCTNQLQIFDSSQCHSYFYVVKLFFLQISTKDLLSILLHSKNEQFLTKMVKKSNKHEHFFFQICNQYALGNFLRYITYL